MSVALSSSKQSKFLRRLLNPTTPHSSSLSRHFSDDSDSPPPPEKPNEQEQSLQNQILQHLLGTPHDDWNSSQPLQSLLSPLSPRALSHIAYRLPSSAQALSFFDYLRNNSSFSNNREILTLVFQSVCEIASREPDSKAKLAKLYKESKEKNVDLNEEAATFLIRFFGKMDMADHSVVVYDGLCPEAKTSYIRNNLIDVLFRDGRVDDALKVVDEMLQSESEFPPDEISADIIFRGLLGRDLKGRSGRRVSKEEIIEQMLKFSQRSIFPNTFRLTQLITRLCTKGKSGEVWDVLEQMLRNGASLESASFNAVLTGLGRDGNIRKINEVLVKMKELDIEPNVVTFGILINNLCKSRRIDEAIEVFDKMREEKESGGVMVEADVITYNTLIDGLCKVGRLDQALGFMEKMKSEKNCAPNTVTYNSLICGFCRAGEIEKAFELFDEMNIVMVKPNVITLNTLVGGMCRHGRVNSAVQFFNKMVTEGCKPNVVTYTILINAFCDANNIDKAMELFNEMHESKCPADVMVYNTLISGLCRAGKLNDAMYVVSKLREAGFSLDLVCYNTLIGALCSRKKLDTVYEMLKDMEETGVKPDSVTYNTLISFFSKTGEFDAASQTMEKMLEDGLVPTVVTYGALIHGHCLQGNIDEALKIFEDMGSRSKVTPNTVIYNILIDTFCKNQRVDRALSLMGDMRAKGVRPNTITYNAMLKGVRDKNWLDKAFMLMDKMTEQACHPDYVTMEILTEWLPAVGETEKLKKFLKGCEVSSSRNGIAAAAAAAAAAI